MFTRYIESIYRCKHPRVRRAATVGRRSGVDRVRAGRRRASTASRATARRAAPTLRTMHRVTDYALARRAVLRDFRRGALTRLDVCDAHPELMRAAQCIGTEIDDECPVCGATNLRLVSYVYGDKLKQAERPRDLAPPTSSPSSARRATSSRVTTSRSASTAAGTTCAGSRSTAACTRAEPESSQSSRRRSHGYCETHETHHSSGSGTTVSLAAGPMIRARRRRAARARAPRRESRSSRRPVRSRAGQYRWTRWTPGHHGP